MINSIISKVAAKVEAIQTAQIVSIVELLLLDEIVQDGFFVLSEAAKVSFDTDTEAAKASFDAEAAKASFDAEAAKASFDTEAAKASFDTECFTSLRFLISCLTMDNSSYIVCK
jgi:hypothetical protein